MGTSTFIEARKGTIGGTDVSAICKVNPYKTPYNVYEEKVEGKVVEVNDAMLIGRCFESGLGRLFKKKTGLEIFSPSEDMELLKSHIQDDSIEYHLTYDEDGDKILILKKGIAHGSIDFFTIDNEGKPAIVECKVMTNNHVESQQDFIKEYKQYYLQVQWYMYITGFRKAYFSTVQFQFGGHIEWYVVDYNEKIVSMMVKEVNDFWNNYIKLGIKPPPSSIDESNKYYDFKTNGNSKVADEELISNIEKFKELKEQIKELNAIEKEAEKLKEKIVLALQDNEECITAENKVLLTAKMQTRAYFNDKDLKADNPDLYEKYAYDTTFRVVRLK